MQQGLQYSMEVETVTFSADCIPEISGYGKKIPVHMFCDKDDLTMSTIIKIGEHMFLPDQIKMIMESYLAFDQSFRAFHEQ
jgi:hypothetical protein